MGNTALKVTSLPRRAISRQQAAPLSPVGKAKQKSAAPGSRHYNQNAQRIIVPAGPRQSLIKLPFWQ
ncbi:MAG: hypothetical protein DU429_02070 [Candidatus Tokpelaia sp.]|nr:MAG: hypothetical protein DU430_03790 [Candidatus Tokpelaia sp.]KAA6207288.1 MAG: hypothetical protein DU429_02070 [Candidatus Tokpelaia sp.]